MLKKARIKFDALFVQTTESGFIQLFRYLFVACAALATDFLTFISLTEIGHVHYILAAIVGFMGGILVNYALSVRWVFANSTYSSRRVEFAVFVFIGFVGLVMTVAIMWVLTEGFSVHPIVSKLMVTAVVFFWNFLARKFWLFNNRNNGEKE